AEIQRIDQLWSELRSRYCNRGHWLFGAFSITDCMFAPVAFRFHTYGIKLSDPANEYLETLLAHPAMQEWARSAREEAEIIEDNEIGLA
ncbi:MAG: glutathione S-transferase C-terminal domain-containing protein, partial [Pseudohongiellaceae bacterium]